MMDPFTAKEIAELKSRLLLLEDQVTKLSKWSHPVTFAAGEPRDAPEAVAADPADSADDDIAALLDGALVSEHQVKLISHGDRLDAQTLMACPACQADPQHSCIRPGTGIVVETHDARVHALRAQRAADAKPTTVEGRVTKIEHTLWGDLETLRKFKEAWRLGVAPRPEKPAPGFFETFEPFKKATEQQLTKFRGFLLPLDVEHSSAPLDGFQIATKAFVDAGLERLANALRHEVGVRAPADYAALVDRVNMLSRSVGAAASFVEIVSTVLFGSSDVTDAAAQRVARAVLQAPAVPGVVITALVGALSKKAIKRMRRKLHAQRVVTRDDVTWVIDAVAAAADGE